VKTIVKFKNIFSANVYSQTKLFYLLHIVLHAQGARAESKFNG